ncbi:autotransporter outer membrane beta-barrel domain-containing protein [Salmonella enterica]|nr:autotransporter outer membrane beta-barrel domain-containing protein [Salmonella enterica]EBG4969209.1 autotransporter outer membrane beta-barrel domain-containing protein [Salmonella enterica subsp. enterica serovar Agoueve]EBS4558566.1 hypothetical protein [Salmonella enterica subsp. enterica serovar Kintambo]EDT2776810.1 autotransporter outer membrane beta-barrel domain-containing protein [Salmonella enterica subsp. enterica]HAU7012068.1 autotransporter outer membrane beta-barrel domain-c
MLVQLFILSGIPEKNDTLVMRPEGRSYIANLAAANTMFVTRLNDRSGKTRYFDPVSGSEKTSSLWLRQIGGHTSWHDNSGQLKTTSNRYVSQFGGDIFKGTFTDKDSWRIGVMGGFGRTDSSTKSTVSGFKSKGSVEGYSSGLYATWYEDDSRKKGGYVDTWMQYNWFDNKVKGDGISSESYDSKGITASLETGYSLGLNDYLGLNNENYEWLVQPQVQVTWMGVKQDSHIESNGTHISNSSYNNIQTRIGGRTFIREQNEYRNQDGTDFEPYLEVNWINNSRLYGVSMNGVSVKQSGSRNIGEIKTGINGNLTPTTGIWGNVGFQIGDNGYNDASVMLGLIYKF